jgi:transposase-like protein
MSETEGRIIAELMERLIAHGPERMGGVFAGLFNPALRPERERFLGAGLYARTADRRGYANGYKAKRVDTPAGTVTVEVPKTRGHDGAPFDPQSLERGRRSCRAVMLAVAEMYVKGVSTRDAARVMAEFGLEGLASTQVSRAAALLDEELQAWRERPLGACPYLVLDARYEKVRAGGIVRDAAVLTAVGVDPDGRRRLLGVSCALSEAEVHWRGFLDGLVARGLRGVVYVVSDDHAGLRAARRAVLPGATWQRCQFHLAQNAIHHAPTLAIRKRIGAELRRIWTAATPHDAEAALERLVAAYAEAAPDLAAWLEANVPEGLAAFSLPEGHRRRLRTANPIERAVQQEIKRRTAKVRVFPSRDALLRLVSAVLAEIDDEWLATDRRYITWDDRDA